MFDLSTSIISGTPILGEQVDNRGGVLFYLAEGENEVPARLRAALANRGIDPDEPVPFVWLTPQDLPLVLLDSNSVAKFAKRAKAISEAMERRFGVPLRLIVIDTITVTAGYARSGDESDAVIGAQVTGALRQISESTKSFVLGVDHFGKSPEGGTRGTSVKETNIDVILAALGERSVEGAVSKTKIALRKIRGGPQGIEFAFTTEIKETGNVDARGRPDTTRCVVWQGDGVASEGAKDDGWGKSHGAKELRKALQAALTQAGVNIKPYDDDLKLTVFAARKDAVRAEFYKSYPTEGDTPKARQDAKQKAFGRAVKDAQAKNLVGVREMGETEYVWFAKTMEKD